MILCKQLGLIFGLSMTSYSFEMLFYDNNLYIICKYSIWNVKGILQYFFEILCYHSKSKNLKIRNNK